MVFVHGNLACAQWFALAAERLPPRFRVVGIDWRGCGASDKPVSEPGFANYSMERHANDMLSVLDALRIERCHLATHSTGGLIGFHMLLAQPERFQRVLALDPACPSGIPFPPESRGVFEIMKSTRQNTRKALALAACTLFQPESLASKMQPVFRESASPEQRELFERLVDDAFNVSDGIWLGTPYHLNRAWVDGDMRARQQDIRHPHLVVWGDRDAFISKSELEEMARLMPSCRLEIIENIGHSLIIENPEVYAQRFIDFLSE